MTSYVFDIYPLYSFNAVKISAFNTLNIDAWKLNRIQTMANARPDVKYGTRLFLPLSSTCQLLSRTIRLWNIPKITCTKDSTAIDYNNPLLCYDGENVTGVRGGLPVIGFSGRLGLFSSERVVGLF